MTSLAERLSAAMTRAGCAGAVAGVWAGGSHEVAAAGLADWETGQTLTPGTRLPVASVTKPVVATAAVRLWQRRGIPLDAPLAELLPDLTDDWRASPRLSLRHLLSNTSGLRPRIPSAELARYAHAADGIERAVRTTIHSGQVRAPGSAWQYCNPGYALAGYALGVVAGTGLEAALREYMLAPAAMADASFGGAQGTGHLGTSPVRGGYPRALRPAGGLIAPVGDLLRFAEFVVDDPSLPVTGRPVASAAMGGRYGLGWVLAHGGRSRWHLGDWGGCHAFLLVVPARRVAVALLSNDDGGDGVRDDLPWAEVSRLSGRRRPRLAMAIHTGRSLVRLAAVTALTTLTRRTGSAGRKDSSGTGAA